MFSFVSVSSHTGEWYVNEKHTCWSKTISTLTNIVRYLTIGNISVKPEVPMTPHQIFEFCIQLLFKLSSSNECVVSFNSYQSLCRSQQVRANTVMTTLAHWHHLWDRKYSWNSDVFHSKELENLLSAGLTRVPCNISLEQYACSSVRWQKTLNIVPSRVLCLGI